MSHPEVKNEAPSRYPDLYSEEIAQSLKHSAYVGEQLSWFRDLGNQLHGDGQLPPDITRQALMIAYSALLSLKNYVAYDEFCESREHAHSYVAQITAEVAETGRQLDQLLIELREVPASGPPAGYPDWLLNLPDPEV